MSQEEPMSVSVSIDDVPAAGVDAPDAGSVEFQGQSAGETGRVAIVAAPQAPAVPSTIPDYVPEKFRSAADPMAAMAKSYAELEKLQSGGKVEPEAAPAAEPSVETPSSEPLTIKNYQDTWALQGGKLEDSQWEKIQEQTGIPMDDLRAYETNVLSQMTNAGASQAADNDSVIYEASGGQDKYDTMIDWATNNLPADQISSINSMLDNPALSKSGVDALRGLYQHSMGSEPEVSTLQKTGVETVGSDEFMSEAEVQFGQSDARYGVDPNYTKTFEQKVLRYMKRSNQI